MRRSLIIYSEQTVANAYMRDFRMAMWNVGRHISATPSSKQK